MKKQNNNKPAFKFITYGLGLLMLSVTLFSCDKNEGSAQLQVRLTDAPGDYQKVNIEIIGVEVNNEAGAQATNWKALTVKNGVYDLLELTNGLDTLIASADLPAGKLSQIRLILGSNNTVVVNGATFPLATPSAQQSGLKLNVQADLTEGILYVITLDFDVARSIIKSGNGTYSLKPVIRALSEATTGAISGTATPLAATPAIFVIQGTDTVATSYTNDAGKFLVQGVPAGIYKVSISPKTGYTPQLKEGVVVTVGAVTNLGVVAIQ
jgi:hypothetical protein